MRCFRGRAARSKTAKRYWRKLQRWVSTCSIFLRFIQSVRLSAKAKTIHAKHNRRNREVLGQSGARKGDKKLYIRTSAPSKTSVISFTRQSRRESRLRSIWLINAP